MSDQKIPEQKKYETKEAALWQKFADQEQLSATALAQFQRYATLLETWAERINLTTIIGTANIIRNHFQDSLEVAKFIDIKTIHTLCDVGTGGGFPGLPLKIAFPHLSIVLIEVNNKKIEFLTTVIRELKLDNVTISDLDWRTFLRKTDYTIDLFCARASLHTDELIRLFKPSCRYNKARLIYWASQDWKAGKLEAPYVKSEYAYTLGSKERRYILMAAE